MSERWTPVSELLPGDLVRWGHQFALIAWVIPHDETQLEIGVVLTSGQLLSSDGGASSWSLKKLT